MSNVGICEICREKKPLRVVKEDGGFKVKVCDKCAWKHYHIEREFKPLSITLGAIMQAQGIVVDKKPSNKKEGEA